MAHHSPPRNNGGLSRRNGQPAPPAATFFTKQTFMVLGVGILFGYVLLPVLMIEMNVEEALQALPTVEVKYPGSINTPSSPHLRPMSDSAPPRNLELAATSSDSNKRSDAEQRLVEAHDIYSSQSMPTYSTPYVMKTPKLPDHQRKKILVTGGAGFVGSHLVDKLMMEGHEVTVIDNFFTGQKKNVAHWFHHPNFRYVLCVSVCVFLYGRLPTQHCSVQTLRVIELITAVTLVTFTSLITHDVTEEIMLEVDQIYHLACPASPPHYQYNPVKTIKTSTEGTLNMLGLAKRVKARILLTSTSEIYGDPKVHPQPESYWGNVNTIGPRSCYDEGKRVAETMMYSYKNQNGVEIRVARIFNTFGPRMHPNDGRVVSNFIIQALQNKDLTIYGDGKQTRSFQYVSDLVDGLHALMNGDYDLPVNLGNPDEYTIKDFAEYITKLTKTKSKIINYPKSEDDPGQRKPDIAVAKAKIGWAPKISVESGLKNTIDYFQRVLDQAGEIIPTGPGAAKPEA
jgi:UDP-glucuronate decarboxylase